MTFCAGGRNNCRFLERTVSVSTRTYYIKLGFTTYAHWPLTDYSRDQWLDCTAIIGTQQQIINEIYRTNINWSTSHDIQYVWHLYDVKNLDSTGRELNKWWEGLVRSITLHDVKQLSQVIFKTCTRLRTNQCTRAYPCLYHCYFTLMQGAHFKNQPKLVKQDITVIYDLFS